jgi:maleylacetate reductase
MSSDDFVYTSTPMRVVFGRGLDPLAEELRHAGITRAVVICAPNRAALGERIAAFGGGRVSDVIAAAQMHVPSEVVQECAQRCKQLDCDGYLAVGGGSAIGLAKALALRSGLPIVAVPTTYSGSEMTPVWGVTENRTKTTGRDPAVRPAAVIYDPTLTLGLPVGVSVASGMNAIAHAVEGLYAPDCSPIVSLMATEGASAMAAALPGIVDDPSDLTARRGALYGAWLCGAVLGATTMSLHHKVCHVLGGRFNLPHAETHAVVLPHVMAFNAVAAPKMVAALSGLFGAGDPATALWVLQRSLPMPHALTELGLHEDDIAMAAHEITTASYANPRPADNHDVEAILHSALRGELPARDHILAGTRA